MTIEEELQQKRADILAIIAKYGAKNVRVFGSVARRESDNQSDVDFLIELGAGFTLFDHAALIRELEQLLNRQVDVVSDKGLRPRIRQQVLKEAVPL